MHSPKKAALYWSRPSGGLYVTAPGHRPLVKIVQYCTDLLKADTPSARIAVWGSFPPVFGAQRNLIQPAVVTAGTAFLGSVQ